MDCDIDFLVLLGVVGWGVFNNRRWREQSALEQSSNVQDEWIEEGYTHDGDLKKFEAAVELKIQGRIRWTIFV